MTKRFKNPYFWIGLLGVIFTAMGVDATTLTTWQSVIDAFKGLLYNPFLLVTVAMAVLGVFVDPSTGGLKDGNSVEIEPDDIDDENETA